MQPTPAQTQFWQWFINNGERLRAMMYGDNEAARENAAAELRVAVAPVEEGIVLEFARSEPGEPRQLIVSADGRPERVDPVKDLVAAAPTLPDWIVTAFRPRMELGDSIEIVLQGERVGPADIWFRVSANDDGLDLTLHVRGLTRDNEQHRGLGASLLAEHAVGERDVLTLLRSLQVEPLPHDPAESGLRPFPELVAVFDTAKAEKYPPPGSLVIDPESDWQNMQGTIEDSPALVLLHAGLRGLAGHPAYDRRLIVSIPFHQARPDGMPATEKEYLAVTELGDELCKSLEEGQESLLVMTIMTQGRRDLVHYTSNAEGALRRLETFRAKVDTHRVEDSVARDTFWGMYRGFCQAGEPGDAAE